MALLHVRALPLPGVPVHDVLRRACRRAAEALDVEAQAVRGTWHTLPFGAYVDADRAARRKQPNDSHPPIVEVVTLEGAAPDVVRACLAAVADEVARGLRLDPQNVLVHHRALPAGSVWPDESV